MTGTKQRILTGTAELFRRQGYNGTGLKQVAAAAAAPYGSLYHFFPGGKDDLAEAVIRDSGSAYRQLLELIFDQASDAATAVTDFFDAAAGVLEETHYVDACPIATVALEVASTNERLRTATADVFASWRTSLAGRLQDAGLERSRAQSLATALIAAFEGALLLSRATRDAEPMRSTGRLMRQLVEAELGSSRGAPAGNGPRARARSRARA